ncbi:signal-induced proliferation-associated 1-like protein 3 isoform X4 [Pangasianodon hypophthalmus]|uniref:signal-induced proliferation-associated 1-like protein 3 isoform X4 n=1 Tax=Pangasianodon hypophthalmus TaxID=310915 RepID=UPI0023078480|nr:signal-induced proliferation-associated 1-like protein 3 isoform X4 [Pangasianodon hypophthalmus]
MLKWSLNRKMEFTRLNTSTKSDNADGGWHMVIAPRSAEKSSDQQDQLDGEFCRSLPRAHFLRPGCFRAAAERGAFSPDSHDLCFKGEWLQDQCSWDSKSSTSVACSCSPHPLAQPGFYSPKIPRSKHCGPSTELKNKNTKEYYSHTLPLPRTKLAVFKQRQVDTKSKNVFGQPRVIATLRSGFTPQPVHKTTVVEDLKKLILMDEVADSPTQTSRSATECLQGSSSPKPLMFSSPVLTRRPVPRPTHLSLQSDPTVSQAQCGLSDTLVWDQDVRLDQEPLNLTNTPSKLDWNSLVNAAEAYEEQEMANLLSGESRDLQSGTSPEPHSPHLPHALTEAPDDNVFTDFPDQLSHLEAVLMRLSTDLLKEKKDKVALLAEVLKLRMSNEQLKEESLSANAQLHKICQMFSINPESVE